MKNVTMVLSIAVAASTLMLTACSSTPTAAERKDEKVLSAGTLSNTRPWWTYEGDLDRKKLAEAMGDDGKDPKNMFVISTATVSNEDLVPNCYQIARTRTSSDLAMSISNIVKASSALASSADANEFQGIIASETQQVVVGAQIAEKTWAKIEANGQVKVHCWVVVGLPRKNMSKLQEIVISQLEKANSGDASLKERVKVAMDKMAQQL